VGSGEKRNSGEELRACDLKRRVSVRQGQVISVRKGVRKRGNRSEKNVGGGEMYGAPPGGVLAIVSGVKSQRKEKYLGGKGGGKTKDLKAGILGNVAFRIGYILFVNWTCGGIGGF